MNYPVSQDNETYWKLIEVVSGSEICTIVTRHQDLQKMIDEDDTEYLVRESTGEIYGQML